MANSQWGKDWNESPTERTLAGQTWYFMGRASEKTPEEIKAVKAQALKARVGLRLIRDGDFLQEFWANDKGFDSEIFT